MATGQTGCLHQIPGEAARYATQRPAPAVSSRDKSLGSRYRAGIGGATSSDPGGAASTVIHAGKANTNIDYDIA